jgi:hypothetical protein
LWCRGRIDSTPPRRINNSTIVNPFELKFFFPLFFFLLVGCDPPVGPVTVSRDSVRDTVVDHPVIPEPLRPSIYELAELDWPAYKESVPLLNCGNSSFPHLWRDTSEGFHYRYCLFNGAAGPVDGDPARDKGEIIAEFRVWMPGKTILSGKELSRERLIGIRCSYVDKHLGGFDLVKKDTSDVIARFGRPDSITAESMIYVRNGELLRVFLSGKKVSSFLWMVVDGDPRSVAEVPGELLE